MVFREDLKKCRETLALERKQLGEPPYTDQSLKAWNTYIENFRLNVETINEKIQKFNLVVPMLHRQMMPYSASKELEKVCSNFEEFLPQDYEERIRFRDSSKNERTDSVGMETVRFRDLWKEMKSVFRKGENT